MKSIRILLLTLALAVFAAGNLWSSNATQSRPMPDGPGKAETQKFCADCHDLDKSLSLKQDRTGWQRTVDKMIASGLKATDTEIAAIIDYLSRSYPADEAPRLKVNEADAIDFESILSIRRSLARAIIEYREKNGPFKSIEDLKKVPGIDAARLEEKKDRLVF
ncbi:MAG: ComEA family DNA-binding protein [Blastocatellia bacterium]